MNDEDMKEKISALMDGEADQAEMQKHIRQIRSDAGHRDCWEHYHLIGDALRNNLPSHLKRDFAACISAAIAKEDLPQAAPARTTSNTEHPRPKRRHPIANPLTGFAVAASVAIIAFIGVGMITVEDQATGPRVASNAPPPVNVAVVPGVPKGIQTVKGEQWNIAQPAVESKLNNYLYNHRDAAGGVPINAQVIPHARLVAGQAVVRGE